MFPRTEARDSPPPSIVPERRGSRGGCGPPGLTARTACSRLWRIRWRSRSWLWPQPSGLLGEPQSLGKASRAVGGPQQSNQSTAWQEWPSPGCHCETWEDRSARPPATGQPKPLPWSQSTIRQTQPGRSGAHLKPPAGGQCPILILSAHSRGGREAERLVAAQTHFSVPGQAGDLPAHPGPGSPDASGLPLGHRRNSPSRSSK